MIEVCGRFQTFQCALEKMSLILGTKSRSNFCDRRSMCVVDFPCALAGMASAGQEGMGNENQMHVSTCTFRMSGRITPEPQMMLDVFEEALDRPTFQIQGHHLSRRHSQICSQVKDSASRTFARKRQKHFSKAWQKRFAKCREKSLPPNPNSRALAIQYVLCPASNAAGSSVSLDFSIPLQVRDKVKTFAAAAVQNFPGGEETVEKHKYRHVDGGREAFDHLDRNLMLRFPLSLQHLRPMLVQAKVQSPRNRDVSDPQNGRNDDCSMTKVVGQLEFLNPKSLQGSTFPRRAVDDQGDMGDVLQYRQGPAKHLHGHVFQDQRWVPGALLEKVTNTGSANLPTTEGFGQTRKVGSAMAEHDRQQHLQQVVPLRFPEQLAERLKNSCQLGWEPYTMFHSRYALLKETLPCFFLHGSTCRPFLSVSQGYLNPIFAHHEFDASILSGEESGEDNVAETLMKWDIKLEKGPSGNPHIMTVTYPGVSHSYTYSRPSTRKDLDIQPPSVSK